jgi:biotin transporter BioY
VQARRITVFGRAWRWAKRNPAIASLLAVIVFVFALGATVSGFYAKQASDRERKAKENEELANRDADLAGILIRLLYSVSILDGSHTIENAVLLVCNIGGILISFPVAAWVVASILHTNFKRACQVLIVNYLMILGLIGLVLGGFYIIFR